MGKLQSAIPVFFGAIVGLNLTGALCAADGPASVSVSAVKPVATKPSAPVELPGKNLAGHDFFFAGEQKSHQMYIVRAGKVVWRYEVADSKGEISDAQLLSNGNILFAHQFGVTLIDTNKKVLWHLDAPEKTEIHTAQMIGSEHVLYVRNGDPAKLFVVNITTGKNVRDITLPVGNPKGTHGHFRHARLTDAGTVMVAHMDMKKVCEYDDAGKQVSSFDAPGIWSAVKLKNGNVLCTQGKIVRETDTGGKTVWEFSQADCPDYKISQFQIATRLPNGNTLMNNWVNPWSVKIDPATAPVQALEVTPDKKIVWALRSWLGENNLGPATTIQILDDAVKVEDVHFGEIK